MPFSIGGILTGILQAAGQVFSYTWWFLVPLILAIIFWELWIFYIRGLYVSSIKWVLLRVKTPREVLRTPKAMEQVFAAAHASYSFGIKPYDKYWKGKVEDWHSFEMVGYAGGVYLFIRVNEVFRNTIESAIYAQYPEAEIEIVDDYIDLLPNVLPNNIYDVFGSDFILARDDDAYPIRTYPYFEAIVAEEKIDTMAAFTEAMSRLKEDETIWIQILVRPTGEKTSDWPKRAERVVNKIAGRKEKAEAPGILIHTFVWIKNLSLALFKEPEWKELEIVKEEKAQLSALTKGEQELIKSIEDKISKPAFESVIRFVYIDRKEAFTRSNISAIVGALKQFNDERKNSLKPNLATMTIAKHLFKSQKLYYKKRQIYDRYRLRKFPSKFSVMNIEELATIYHFPTTIVEAPMIRRVEAKRGGPPLTLPVQ